MYPIIQKTFGGLSLQYYFRQFLFGLALAVFLFFMSTQGEQSMSVSTLFFTIASTLFYPYSRFAYESIIGFIMGDNVFFVNAVFMLIVKCITMVMCWAFALFIAPIGLIYLYCYHSKAEH